MLKEDRSAFGRIIIDWMRERENPTYFDKEAKRRRYIDWISNDFVEKFGSDQQLAPSA